MRISGTAAAISFVLAFMAVVPSYAADPAAAPMAVPDAGTEAGVVVNGPGRALTLVVTALAALPSVQVSVPAGPGPNAKPRMFQGPLLWTMLVHAGLVDPTKHQSDVRGSVVVTGRDGYTAVLALGELSPEFEGKQVILALQVDGQAIDPSQLRIVVPGDKRGGRGVHDLVRISLLAEPTPAPSGH